MFVLKPTPSKGPLQARVSLWMQEDSHRRGALQTGKRLIKANRCPLEMMESQTLQYKLQEPVLLPGKEQFVGVSILVLGLCEGWWFCGSNLCHSTVHPQSPCGLLPKICG